MKYTKRKFGGQDGVAAILTILFITFFASVVISLASIILPRLRVSAQLKSSVGALYAADSAIEWCLYRAKDPSAAAPVMQNGAVYTLYVAGTQDPPSNSCSTVGSPAVKSVGIYQNVTRSLQVSGF